MYVRWKPVHFLGLMLETWLKPARGRSRRTDAESGARHGYRAGRGCFPEVVARPPVQTGTRAHRRQGEPQTRRPRGCGKLAPGVHLPADSDGWAPPAQAAPAIGHEEAFSLSCVATSQFITTNGNLPRIFHHGPQHIP